jgi:membrane protein YdbS with pleckstrin-like domain
MNSSNVIATVLVLLVFSFVQPEIILITKFEVSTSCMECSIFDQMKWVSLFYVFAPMLAIFLILFFLKTNRWIVSSILAAYFTISTFWFMTVPLFKDRYASYSTFSDEEIPISAGLMSFPSQIVLSLVLFMVIFRLNRREHH